MIGTVKRQIAEIKIVNQTCPSCNEQNTLVTKIYSKFFLLKILPFVFEKSATVDCTHCKKHFPNENSLEPKIKDKVEDLKTETKHPWYTYIGYAIMAFFMILALLTQQ